MINKRYVWLFTIIIGAAFFFQTGCRTPQDHSTQFRVAVLFAPDGKGDHSYNDMAVEGINLARRSISFDAQEIQPARVSDYEAALRSAASGGSHLVIAIGFLYSDPIKQVAKEFPATNFVVVDGDAGSVPNIRSITFRPEEGSFLVGALAAHVTKSKKLGFIAGMDIPIMHRFECGYVDGIRHVDPNIVVLRQYIGVTPAAFSDPGKGREIAKLMYRANVDIIFHAAGGSGNGVIEAAKDERKLVIGVDADQSWMAPQSVLTSMRKRVDLVVQHAIEDASQKRFTGGVQSLGLKEGGIDYVPPHLSSISNLDKELVTKINELRDSIVAGKIAVCSGHE